MGRSQPNGGRGGRGFNRGGNQAKRTAVPEKLHKKQFHPLSSAIKSKDSYEDVEAHLLDYIRMQSKHNIEDMVTSIRDQKLIDLDAFEPRIAALTKTDPDERELELEENKEKYSMQLKNHIHRVENLKENKYYVRSLVLQRYITREMDVKIRNEADFDTVLEDPIQLLKRIEGFSKRSEDGNYDVWYLWETLSKWTNMKQGPTEGLPRFKERFLRQAELVQEQLGTDVFENFAATTTSYGKISDPVMQQEYKTNSFEMITAVGMVCNSNQKLTGNYVKELREDYVKGRDDYPKTVEKAQQCMQAYIDSNKTINGVDLYQNQQKNGGKGKPGPGRACYVCGKKDHVSPECPDKLKPKEEWKNSSKWRDYSARPNLAQTGNPAPAGSNASTGGDSSSRTPGDTNPGNTLAQFDGGLRLVQVPSPNGRSVGGQYFQAVPRGTNMMQTNVRRGFNANQFRLGAVYQMQRGHNAMHGNFGYNNLDIHEYYRLETSPPIMMEEENVVFPGGQFIVQREPEDEFHDPFDLYTRVILDSGATDSTFCNANFLGEIHPANNPLHMCTNAGSRMIHEEGQCGNFMFDAYYDPNGVANVLSLNQLILEGYTVTMDSDELNEFIVHCGDGDVMRFSNRSGIYVLDREDDEGPDPTTQDSFSSRLLA